MTKTKMMGLASAALMVSAAASNGAIVINEGYGGGGNSGSTFKSDFVELYNNGLTGVDISGYQVQYASATGSFSGTITTDDGFSTIIPAGTTLAAGAFYVLVEGTGAGGTTATPGNYTDTTAINMSGTTFKLRLNDATGTVLDLVGVGPTASLYEGTGPAPVVANATSSQRLVAGVDTNNNNVDFTTAAPTPGSAIPEPATLAALAGFAVLGLRRRSR